MGDFGEAIGMLFSGVAHGKRLREEAEKRRAALAFPLVVEPDERLHKVCAPVTFDDKRRELRKLIDGMYEVMREYNGIGLAAPQVGVLKRVIVLDVPGHGPLTMINPQITASKGRQTAEEGCLSLPGERIKVVRATDIRVSFENLDGVTRGNYKAKDLLARVIQHEVDHLDGIVITDLKES